MGNPHLAAMAKLLESCRPRHDIYPLFSDAMEMMAISLANAVDLRQRDTREERYLQIAGRYDRETLGIFPRVLGELVEALEWERGDVLGSLFHDLELHNRARGQFFTPFTVCKFMAEATLGEKEELTRIIEQRGFLMAMEPACGSGAMVIALADTMLERGINYQRHLHVTAVDIDARAIHMAYCQLSLLHVPTHLIVGNSISGEVREHWYTPAHILGGWNARLAMARRSEGTGGAISPAPPTAFRQRSEVSTGANDDDPAIPVAPAGPRQLSLF